MLNHVILFALRNRLLIVGAALAVLVLGAIVASSLPIDVLPSLTRPRVVLVTESPGLAPEEVEQLVTIPLESAVNGASGVIAVRTESHVGLSIVNVEFDWNVDVYLARQIVQERITGLGDRLPRGVQPTLSPVSSLLGQIMLIGMWSEDGETDSLDLRTLGDWVVRQRLLAVEGVSQVIVMGGGRMQYQVLVDLHRMHQYEVEFDEIEAALRDGNTNAAGGYVERLDRELLIRGLGRVATADDVREIVVKESSDRPVRVKDVAEVRQGAQIKRGDSTVNGREAVVLTVQKQPNVDTRLVTQRIEEALAELRGALPADVVVRTTYQQREFIDHAVANVVEALRDGAVLVVIVLFLFLLNFRTTFITLTAIPLSILVTAIVFRFFGLTINVMTLGGLAVALGELVDDAIVDVENIFRRLRENARSDDPRPPLRVIYEASSEVRGAIIISTVIIAVVFAPLFALSGIEGRLFAPLGVAYLVSIFASTVVSLTVTPVLSYYLLPRGRLIERREGFVLRGLKRAATPLIRASLRPRSFAFMAAAAGAAIGASLFAALQLGADFLPLFNEGAAQVNLMGAPGMSLSASRRLGEIAEDRFAQLRRSDERPDGPLLWYTGKTGRAEQDEHVMGVNVSEYVMTLAPEAPQSVEELKTLLLESVEDVPGVEVEVEQPIAHLISHLLSGVTAEIAVKIYGDDLDLLRRSALEVQQAVSDVPGITPPVVEQQAITPQLRVEVDRNALARYGVSARFVQDYVETAINGRVASQVVEGRRSFDLLVRLAEPYRLALDDLHRAPLELPDGRRLPLGALAEVYESGGPNKILREDGRRRIVVRINTLGRDLEGVVADIRRVIEEQVVLPEGSFIEYGGQFEAQRQASRRILWLSAIAIAVVFAVLYSSLPSTRIVIQILAALPAAFVGGVAALAWTGQSLSVPAMVGFISLGGIAARNGLLLVSTYLSRIEQEGFSPQTLVSGSLDRLAPVLMTALTTGLGLLPLVIDGDAPGKEMLYPVATVILGGLATSTVCEFLLRPGLFFFFAEADAKRMASRVNQDDLDAPPAKVA